MVYALSTKSVNFFLIGGMSAVQGKFSIRRLIVAIYHVTMVTFDSVNV
jgi:hypothetical protein